MNKCLTAGFLKCLFFLKYDATFYETSINPIKIWLGEKNPGQCFKDTGYSPMGVSSITKTTVLIITRIQELPYTRNNQWSNYYGYLWWTHSISECQKHFCKTQGHIIHFIPRMIQLAINKTTNLCCCYKEWSADFTVINGPRRFWSNRPKG